MLNLVKSKRTDYRDQDSEVRGSMGEDWIWNSEGMEAEGRTWDFLNKITHPPD